MTVYTIDLAISLEQMAGITNSLGYQENIKDPESSELGATIPNPQSREDFLWERLERWLGDNYESAALTALEDTKAVILADVEASLETLVVAEKKP